MKTLNWGAALICLLALGLVGFGEATGDADISSDGWWCASGDDPEYGTLHYDNVHYGLEVHAPDGQHVTWGLGFCSQSHTLGDSE